jgi:hypothetical protein
MTLYSNRSRSTRKRADDRPPSLFILRGSRLCGGSRPGSCTVSPASVKAVFLAGGGKSRVDSPPPGFWPLGRLARSSSGSVRVAVTNVRPGSFAPAGRPAVLTTDGEKPTGAPRRRGHPGLFNLVVKRGSGRRPSGSTSGNRLLQQPPDPTRSRRFDFRHENPGMRLSGNSTIVFGLAGEPKKQRFSTYEAQPAEARSPMLITSA